MAETHTQAAAAPDVTLEAFYADRRRIWSTFTGFTMGGAIAVAVLLILMAIFLL